MTGFVVENSIFQLKKTALTNKRFSATKYNLKIS